jgi:hypothetical protein
VCDDIDTVKRPNPAIGAGVDRRDMAPDRRAMVWALVAARSLARSGAVDQCDHPQILDDEKQYSYGYLEKSCGSLFETTCGHAGLIGARKEDNWCAVDFSDAHLCCARDVADCCEVNAVALANYLFALVVVVGGLSALMCACCPCCPLFRFLCCAPRGRCQNICLWCPGRQAELTLASVRMTDPKAMAMTQKKRAPQKRGSAEVSLSEAYV